MAELQLDPHKTALVIIDLQNAIVAMSTAPHPAAQVVGNSVKLAEAFRASRRSGCLRPRRLQRLPRASR